MIGYSGGGSDQSLFLHLINLNREQFFPVVIYRNESNLVSKLKENKILTIHQKFFSSNFKTKKKKRIKFPGSKTFIFNLKVLIETCILVKTIILSKVDIIHINNNLRTNRAAAIAGLVTFRKVIVHDRMGFKLGFVDKLLVKKVDKVIAISESVKSQYRGINFRNNRIVKIYNGIDTSLFKPIHRENNDKIVIGSVGRLYEWKGVHVLINAIPKILEKNQNCRFIIIGEGNEKQNLAKLSVELKVRNFVSFLGFCENIHEMYHTMDIFVHTAIEPEPFGRVIIEAMASGLPVISTNIGGPKEIITHGKDGFLIEPRNSDILADIILSLISKHETRKKIGLEAIKSVSSNYEIKKITKKIQKIYLDNN